MELPFGKHQGKELSEVPKSYLEWLYGELEEEIAMKQALLEEIEDELNLR